MSETAVEGRLLGRALRIGRVLARYGLKERGAGDVPRRERARNLRAALEELGPTFAKLGQILSTRPDLLPPEFIDELSTLQDQVTPLTEAEVVGVMEQELGVPWEDVFESIDPNPLAAGTIGQVHKATLESGDRVVVKVQRPGAADEIMRDLGLLEMFAERAKTREALQRLVDLSAVIEHLSGSLRRELDFGQEADNLERLHEVLAPFGRLATPRVYRQLSTPRLLVLEYIDGVPIRKAPESPLRKDAARQLIEAYYRQILVDGFFHADPHPGNLLWWNDTVYFLDAGMVGEIDHRTRELLLMLVMAFWQEDDQFLGEIVLSLAGEDQWPDVDLAAFGSELGQLFAGFRHQSLQEIQLGPVLQGITQVSARHDVRLPASLALTAKAMAQMQLAAAVLDPDLDPMSVVPRFLARLLAERMRASMDPRRVLYEGKKLRERIGRLVEAFERMAGARPGQRFQVDFPALAALETTIRRSVRRLALASGAAATIVATGFTASSEAAGDWLSTTMGIAAAVLSGMLIADFLWPRRR